MVLSIATKCGGWDRLGMQRVSLKGFDLRFSRLKAPLAYSAGLFGIVYTVSPEPYAALGLDLCALLWNNEPLPQTTYLTLECLKPPGVSISLNSP